jgi:ribonuclease HI
MFHNENGGTFWVAKDSFPVPVHMAVYVDSSYDSPNASVKESFKHHSSGFVFWTGGGSLREVNYGLTRQDYKPERLLTSENAELIGINKVLKYILTLNEQPERLTIVCDNQTLVKKLNDIREVYKILGRFPISEYPKAWHKAEYDTYMHLMRSFSEIDLTFQHIKGHADSHFNHIADRLAHLGKSIKSGAEHSEEQILRNLSNDSISWHKEFMSQEAHGEFFLGISEKRYEVQPGSYRYAFCLYDAKNDVYHEGIFGSVFNKSHENNVLAAVHALQTIYPLLPRGFNANIIVPDIQTANILHAYASDYVIPEGILHKNTALALAENRKTVKRYHGLSFLTQGKIWDENESSKTYRLRACAEAEEAMEEYIFHRSLYALKPLVTDAQLPGVLEDVTA